MKKIFCLFVLMLGVLVLDAQRTAQQELDRAIYLEEVDGNLDQALNLYQKIIADFKGDRSVVAEALYRTGLVNEKLGNQKAVSYYQNIVNNYSDQSRQLAMAKKRLNTIYATMNVSKEEEAGVSLHKIYAAPGKMFGSISHNGKYYCAYENLNLYLYDLSSGKKTAITTKGKADSLSSNAMPGVWSMDDNKVAFPWHHGNDHWSLEIWDRNTDQVTTIVEAGEFIYPLDWTQDGEKILIVFGPRRTVETHIGILNLMDGSREELFTLGQLWGDFSTISPNGEYIVHTKDSENGDKDLYLFSVKDKSSQLISNNSSNEIAYWRYDGKAIILKSERSGNPALYEWKFQDGKMLGDPQLIYDGINEGFNVECMSKNGEVILGNSHSQSSIFIAEANFQEGKIIDNYELFDNASDYFLPAWSPDGNRIAMYQKGNALNSTNLVISDLQGKIQKNIDLGFIVHNSGGRTPIWTPEGKICVPIDRREEAQKWELVMIQPETGKMEACFFPYFNRPEFVSDDIYYVSLPEWINTEEYGIMKINRMTEEQELIYQCPEDTFPGPISLSPDKKKLVFRLITKSGNRDSHHALMILNLEDQSVKEIFKVNVQERFFKQPTWYPDNRHIQFDMVDTDRKTGLLKDGEEVAVELDTDTGDYRILPRLPLGKDESIPWRIRNINYDISPDGKHVLYTKENITTNFWALKY